MKKKVTKSKVKRQTLMDRLPSNYGERLLLYIKFTERVISNPPLPSEESFVGQLVRLNKELEEWKKANKNCKLRNL